MVAKTVPRRDQIIKMEGTYMAYVITDECLSCGTCAANCPAEAIDMGGQLPGRGYCQRIIDCSYRRANREAPQKRLPVFIRKKEQA